MKTGKIYKDVLNTAENMNLHKRLVGYEGASRKYMTTITV